MRVRSNKVYTTTQYNKRGDHPHEYIWSVATPILDEDPENPWPKSGRLGSLDECKVEDLRYSVFAEKDHKDHKFWDIELGW